MNNVTAISSKELLEKIESNNSNYKYKKAALLLLEAMNDWPSLNTTEPEIFLLELTKEIGSPLTFDRIENYSKTLSIKNSAWQVESISSLLEIFDENKTYSLDEIIKDILEYYKLK